MKDPPRVILLDSNAYFRLARSIHPLLACTFGSAAQYSLFVLKELDEEYRSNVRLQTKFEWVRDPEHCADRLRKRYQARGKWSGLVSNAFTFLAGHVRCKKLNVSHEDLRALATGFVLGSPVVTDDRDMKELADAFQIECWSVLKLLRLMQVEGRIGIEDVQQVLEYLDEENDLPMGKDRLRREYRQYFNADCPI